MNKKNFTRKLTTALFVLMLLFTYIYNAVGQPQLAWKKTYMVDKMPTTQSYSYAINHFTVDPTDSNRLLNIFVAYDLSFLGTTSDCFWNMTLLNTNTGEFVGEPIALNSRGAHADTFVRYFCGLGKNLTNITYYLENDTLNFVCGISYFGYNSIGAYFPTWFQTFKVNLSNDGLNLHYYPNGTIFPDTTIHTDNPDSTKVCLSFRDHRNREEELYYVKDFGLFTRELDTANNRFTICRIDTSKLDTFQMGSYEKETYKRDTIGMTDLFEDVEGLPSFLTEGKIISSYHRNLRQIIDIDDTLSLFLCDITQTDRPIDNTNGCLMVYYNRATGEFYDKKFINAQSNNRTNYKFDAQNNTFYAIDRLTSSILFKRLHSNGSTVFLNYSNTPLLKDKDFSNQSIGVYFPSNYYIHSDSIIYIFGGYRETGSINNQKVYLAKYDTKEINAKLLWEEVWEAEDTLAGTNILVRNNDVYLYGYRGSDTNTNKPYRVEYFKITEQVSIKEVDNDLLKEYKVSIYPNPTSATSTLTLDLETQGSLIITLNNLLGQELSELHNAFTDAGTFTKTFSIADLPIGIYYLKIFHNGNLKIEKVIKN